MCDTSGSLHALSHDGGVSEWYSFFRFDWGWDLHVVAEAGSVVAGIMRSVR